MPMGRCTAGIAVFALLISPVSLPAQNGAAKSARTITAVRASEKVILDGVLNDRVWEAALPATEFTQRDPDEGKPATERTELRVAYDDFNIYFGVRLFDTEPQKIVRQLSRRDNYADADTFTIQISPYHDRLTGAVFEVSAAGVQRDAIVSNDVFTDYSWEGVWESSVQVDELGWCLEIRVPFSQLRFPRAERQVWGINAARFIHRKNESVWLQLVPKTENGLASRMDDLAGIDGIEAHKHLDLMPYVVGRSEFVEPSSRNNPFNDGSRFFGSTGLDIKYGISSNFTLDATVNPDFGQVEVDPAVVNLSAFETFFPEKRPFFLEGANIFNNFGRGGSNNFWGFNRQEPNLFYSRRIGRPPQRTAEGDFVDSPTATTILGAGKLTGKTRSSWTFGLVEAVTGREYAKTLQADQRFRVEVEPLTNYFVGRVLKEKNRGGFGFLATGVQRDLSLPALRDLLPGRAYVAGGDGYFYLDSDKEWVVTGKLAGSWMKGNAAAIDNLERSSQHYFQRPDARHVRLHPGATSMQGWTGSVNLNRQRGNVTFNASLWGTSPGFESNDVGFQTGGDIAGTHAVVLYRKPSPDRWTRSRYAWAAKWTTWNFARQIQGNGWNGEAGFTTMSYWSFWFNGGGNWPGQDDRLTRGGPAAIGLAGGFLNLGGYSDSRKKISLNYYYGQGSNRAGGWNKQGNVGMNLKPSSSFTISTGPSVNRSRGIAQYVQSVTDTTAVHTYGNRYVFADIDQFQVSMTTRVNWTLSPRMSLQVFAQPLISVGDYWDFKEFARPKTFSFSRFGYDIGSISASANASPGEKRKYTVDPDGDGPGLPFTFDDPDFNLKSLRINAIFRWEWKLGSTLYFVWTENREDKSNPGQFSTQDIGRLFTAHANDIFLVRLAYWFTR